MADIKKIRESEPVRVWLYPLVVAAIGIAVSQGYIDADMQGLIIAAMASLLGIGTVEAVRGRVAPVRPAQHVYVNPIAGYEIPGRHELVVDDTAEFESAGAHAQTETFPVVRDD